MPASTVGAESQRCSTVRSRRHAARRRVAGASLLLVLDDLHWADKPTLLLLRHIVRASDPAALCIVGTYHDGSWPAHPLAEMLADLRREPIGVTRLALRPRRAARSEDWSGR
jgi:predicted ATPase